MPRDNSYDKSVDDIGVDYALRPYCLNASHPLRGMAALYQTFTKAWPDPLSAHAGFELRGSHAFSLGRLKILSLIYTLGWVVYTHSLQDFHGCACCNLKPQQTEFKACYLQQISYSEGIAS